MRHPQTRAALTWTRCPVNNPIHVAFPCPVPSPHGVLSVVTLSFFVGMGMGPRMATPYFLAMPFIISHISSSSVYLLPASLILANSIIIYLLLFCFARLGP